MEAAVRQLADGRNLLGLGLVRGAIAEAANYAPGTVNNHFGTKERRLLEKALMKWLGDDMVAHAAANALEYLDAAELVREGAGGALFRKRLAKALLGDVADYDAGDEDDWDQNGRERLYYLALALCQVDDGSRGVDYAAALRSMWNAIQDEYAKVYDAICEATNRTYVTDRDRTRNAITAYLEGINTHRRFGVVVDDAEVVDVVIRLFYITTRPSDGAAIDVDTELFGHP
jgi:AcrR family transcriptional regulator